MKKLIMQTKVLEKKSRYRIVRILVICFCFALIAGCDKISSKKTTEEEGSDYVDVSELSRQNSDIFAWIRIPEAGIDYPVLQRGDGDDSFYQTHDYLGKEDPKGAIYIEAANLNDMCDFNEVLHGSSPSDGTMFAPLSKFLDQEFFDEHKYIYVYMKGNALIYYTFAAYLREDTRLLEQYDFSYASGCQQFLDEIYSRSMSKIVREGWENQVQPDNFIITLSTVDPSSGKQLVVVGCLVGDVAGKIDRYVDYDDPDDF